ncbi:MAG: outer membrane beta-barrel protein [Candidatus Aquirickettsiella sp.]
MFKKIISTTVLGASVLSAMAASAAAPGIYIGGQFGYADTDMGSKTNFAKFNLHPADQNNQNLSNNGLAGRIALGYQFNQNFAVEAGYLQLSNRKVNISEDQVRHDFPLTAGSVKLQQNVVDFVGKGMLPVTDKINLYGKLGLAYITTPIQVSAQILNPHAIGPVIVDANVNEMVNVSKHKWAPEAAIGVSYDISSNVNVDASWTHIQPLGHNKPGNIDFVAVGVGYNFG